MYAVIVTSDEARRHVPGDPVLTHKGAKFWIMEDREGWVPATSRRVGESNAVPSNVKTWEVKEEAEKFAVSWKGHPWWCIPNGYEIVELVPRYVQDGWNRKSNGSTNITNS